MLGQRLAVANRIALKRRNRWRGMVWYLAPEYLSVVGRYRKWNQTCPCAGCSPKKRRRLAKGLGKSTWSFYRDAVRSDR